MSGNGIEKMAVGMTGEERHDMRLMTLLQRMVREKRLKGAAETLRLDPRTVQTSMERGDLSELVRMALERHMLVEDDQQALRQRERTDALERRMGALEKELHDGIEAVKGEIDELRKDQEWRLESLEQRLARRETQQENLPRPADAPNATGLTPEEQPLHGLWRSTQLDWRKATVSEVRRAVAWRRLVRKVLTLGLWRSRWWRGRA